MERRHWWRKQRVVVVARGGKERRRRCFWRTSMAGCGGGYGGEGATPVRVGGGSYEQRPAAIAQNALFSVSD